ncbi:unnamed protein product [Schistosoma mattheei]|uniref:Uncharacterized protein n=1 Tax=Schistosoma mattheei TaxID=31246 RepID=A0A183P4Y2_9TREM|nr:unnamed protein product [Schistosoma mattheei]
MVFSKSIFYRLPKIHKTDVPLKPLFAYINLPTYNLSRYLAKILKPYESVIKYGMKHPNELNDIITTIPIEDELMASFDACSFFANIPVKRALDIIHNLLDPNIELE